MDFNKGLDVDKITMSSELWYLRNYKNDYNQVAYTVPAKSPSSSTVIEVLPWTISSDSFAIVEVQDVSTGRWYELQNVITLPLNTTQYQLLISPLTRGTSAGIGIWRPNNVGGSTLPAFSLNLRLRTFIPPFTT